jgi:hypothetical protein
MSKRANLVGRKFGRLRVISFSHIGNQRQAFWNCLCRCKNKVVVSTNSLTTLNIKSCGCLRNKFVVTHGLYGTSVYNCWKEILSRCYRIANKSFRNYGGRGIKVCAWIKKSPLSMEMLIGSKPGRDLTIDRKNNNGHYSCGICRECKLNGWPMNLRWATRKQQANSKRHKKLLIKFSGSWIHSKILARKLGLEYRTLYYRIKHGWLISKLQTT